MDMTFADLVLITGELVRIECPLKHEDQLYDSLDSCRKGGDWWSPNAFSGCSAEFMGLSLDRVDMSKVVGML